jgi:ribosomal protein S27E
MNGSICPHCQRSLPPEVVNGPAQAVVRCAGCSTLLLWSNGRVMRSARAAK